MLYIVFVVVFAAVALHDHRTGASTSAHAPQPWDGGTTASSANTTHAKRRHHRTPYRNPYHLRPYKRSHARRPRANQYRRPGHPVSDATPVRLV